MPAHTPRQLALPVHGDFLELSPASPWCQRWREGRHSWTHRHAGGFHAENYTVAPVNEATAKAFVRAHHYLASYPVACRRYGLYLVTGDLVGVAVFGIPAQAAVLTNPLPDLKAYSQSLELSRFVLEGEPLSPGKDGGRAPGNSESWFLSRALQQLALTGVQAVVAFSDPVARKVGSQTMWPGHYGTIYQASNALYTGRGTPRLITVLPDGTTLSDRVISKIRRQEQGHQYAERRLIALGAQPRIGGAANAADWLQNALHDVGALRLRHPGCHRYVMATSRTHRRNLRVAGTALPYPKPAATDRLSS